MRGRRSSPEFDVRLIEKMDEYAMALSHAHTLFSLASRSADPLRALVEEGRKLRATLVAHAAALVRRGHLGDRRLKDLRGPKGHQDLAFDLQLVAALFRETFSRIADKSGVQLDELFKAQQIAASIVRAIGQREKGTARLRAAADIRVRAFTLLTRRYDQARRAVTYLRWEEGDVQKIAPSLYTGRGGRKRAREKQPAIAVADTEQATEDPAASTRRTPSATSAQGALASTSRG